MTDALEVWRNKIEELESREAIRELMAKYAHYATIGQYDQLAELFTEDATLILRDKKAKTRSGIAEWMRQNLPPRSGGGRPSSWNVAGNISIQVRGSEAEATSFWFFTGQRVTDGKPESMVGSGRYLDRLRREDGKWLFAERIIEVGFLVPLSKGWAGEKEFYDLVEE